MALGLLLFASGCMTAPFDGQRVAARNSQIAFAGYATGPSTMVRVQARNPSTGQWVQIGTATSASSPTYTLGDGNRVYSWSVGNRTLSNTYWVAGTGGHYARVRTQMYDAGNNTWYNAANTRADAAACFLENWSFEGMANHCFSHRAETYVYTQDYSIAPSSCANPTSSTPKKNGHYLLPNIPSCARNIIHSRMAEKVSHAFVDSHYQIEHNASHLAHSTEPVTWDGRTFTTGGFFGGHEKFIRDMKRHLMVYDYAWMPRGEFPSWSPSTTVLSPFQNGVPAPNGSCLSTNPASRGPNCCSSQSASCPNGWYSGVVHDTTPNISALPPSLPSNICEVPTAAQLHTITNLWHGDVHCTVGDPTQGAFDSPNFARGVFCRSFDNPSFPLFFLWHNHVNDIWLDWKACGHPIP